MLRICLILLLCATGIFVSDGASARPGHGGIASGAASPCPQGTGTPADGCSALYTAGLQGTVQYSNAFTNTAIMPGSGQSYTTRTPWNVAGVDYPVGVPASVSSFIDPAVTPPTNCSYSATGSSAGGPKLTCSGGAVSIIGYNLGPVGGHQAPVLHMNNTVTSLVIEDDKFQNDSNTNGSSALNDYPLYLATPGSTDNVTFKYNTINGECPVAGGSLCNYGIVIYTAGALDEEFNAFINPPSRQAAGCDGACTTLGDLTMANNMWLGICFGCNSGFHGEVIEQVPGTSGTPTTQTNVNYNYNTIVSMSGEPAYTTALIYLSGGSAGIGPATYTNNNVIGNTLISNCNTGTSGSCSNGGVQITSAMVDFQNGFYTNVALEDNYSDLTGTIGNIRADCDQIQIPTGSIDGSGILTVSGSAPTSDRVIIPGTPYGSLLWISGASGIRIESQLTSTRTADATLSGATILGTVISYAGVTGTIEAGDLVMGSGVTAGTTFVSSAGALSWNISTSQTQATPETITANPPQGDGTYQTSAVSSVSSQAMAAYGSSGTATLFNITLSGNVNLVTGAALTTFGYANYCYVPTPISTLQDNRYLAANDNVKDADHRRAA